MSTIKKLDKKLINKIAAGEVIERPSSIVKELIENSLDAESTSIKIEIEDGGKKLIRITDDGKGMSFDDLMLSYLRHTTSKISKEEDLENIHSLGFRGEALGSIAEISNLKIFTSNNVNGNGFYLELEEGNIIAQGSEGKPRGTTIEVRNIFYNLPVRLKHLKNKNVELNYIIDIVTKYALLNKNIGFQLISEGRKIVNSPKTENELNNIVYIYGREVGKNLLEINYKEDDIEIKGFITKPSVTRSDTKEQTIFVNNRFIKNNNLAQAVYDAYQTLLFIKRHPIFVLKIHLNEKELDVNVHPAKTTIKIQNEAVLCNLIFQAIKETLSKNSLIRNVDLKTGKRKPVNNYSFSKDEQKTLVKETNSDDEININDNKYFSNINNVIGKRSENNILENQDNIKYDESLSKIGLFENFRILGQINKTFIVCENTEGLALIDQHAAQERVNYEDFMTKLKNKAIKKQKLLGKVIELSPEQYFTVSNNKEFLEKFGFELELFGNNTINLKTIPEIFGNLKSTLFIDVINQIGKNIVDLEIEKKITKYSCLASIKAGDELTFAQMKQLIIDLGKVSNPYSCPHGRPTVINFSVSDLEKKFKRTG